MSHLEINADGLEKGKPTLELIINGGKFEWKQQYILGAEVRKLGKIPSDHEIFLDIEKPWNDEVIVDDTRVDLARPGIEQFFSKAKGNPRLVKIFINEKPYEIERGKHTVAEIKKLGGVPQAHELSEVINGKLEPLADTATVLIKGGEQFFSCVKDGSSS